MEVFEYIIQLGAAVMMPIIFTILGVCLLIKPSKAFHSGLFVGVGFVGLGIITALLTDTLTPHLDSIVTNFGLQLTVFDMGWPAAAGVAYNAPVVGALIIPVCLLVNVLMLVTKTTRTVNIDLWNYWHFAFIGAITYYATGGSILWGFFAAIICYIITMVMADLTAPKFQEYYDDMDGISIPQPFCQGFVPFAAVLNKGMDMIPGFDKLNIDADGMKKKFGILGEPLILGIIVGGLIAAVAQFGAGAPEVVEAAVAGIADGSTTDLAALAADSTAIVDSVTTAPVTEAIAMIADSTAATATEAIAMIADSTAATATEAMAMAADSTAVAGGADLAAGANAADTSIANKIKEILVCGIKMGAVMELIPRITRLFIEGLMPISQAAKELIAKKFKNSKGLNIGMTPALVIGHPTTLVASLILIPIILFLSVILPGNKFLPLASLAGMFYVFPMILPITKGNVVKCVIIGLVSLVIGLYFVTDLAPSFSSAAATVYQMTGDATVHVPDGFTQGAALDFASSLFSWAIYHLIHSFEYVGSAILAAFTLGLMYINRKKITKEETNE